MQISQAVTTDFPDLQLSTGLEVITGLLYVLLSSGGSDFIAFLLKGQRRQVNWAGKPTVIVRKANLWNHAIWSNAGHEGMKLSCTYGLLSLILC